MFFICLNVFTVVNAEARHRDGLCSCVQEFCHFTFIIHINIFFDKKNWKVKYHQAAFGQCKRSGWTERNEKAKNKQQQ